MFPSRGTAAALALLVASCALAEDPWFTSRCTPLVGHSYFHLVDLDADGDLDLVTAGDPTLLYANDGTGLWAEPIPIIDLQSTAGLVAFTDLTNDGRPDILAQPSAQPKLLAFENVGGNAFSLLRETTLPMPFLRTTSGDLNADGNIDVIVFTGGHTMLVLLGNGGGQFEVGTPTPIIHRTSTAFIFDATADGAPDLIAVDASETDAIHVYANDGAGGLEYLEASPWLDGGPFVRAEDIDGDDNIDLLTTVGGQPHAFRSSGTGAFSPQALASVTVDRIIDASDLDGDGDLDPVALHDEGIIVLRQQAPMSFTPESYDTGAPLPRWARLDDVTGDGRADVVATNESIAVTPADQQGGFVDAAVSRAPAGTPSFSKWADARILDVNDDGIADLTWTDREIDSDLHIELGRPDGTFDQVAAVDPVFSIGDWLLCDVYHDARPELIWCDAEDGSLHVEVNNDDGMFHAGYHFDDLNIGALLTTADLDSDGRDEIIARLGAAYGGALAFIDLCGEHELCVDYVFSIVDDVAHAIPTDLDADGDPDLIIVRFREDSLAVIINHGPQTFEVRSVAGGVSGINSIRLRDVDGDGDEDVDLTESHRVLRSINLSNGMLTPPLVIFETDHDIEFVEDLDGDGTLDVMSAGPDGIRTESMDDPDSTAHYVLPAPPVAVAAMDRDGDIDIIGPGYVAWNRAIYECAGDVNGDHVRDMQDLGALLASFGLLPGDPYFDPEADLNGDGTVDLTDLGELLAVFDTPCS